MSKIRVDNRGSISAVFVIILSILVSILIYTGSASLANKIGIERTYNNDIALNIADGGIEKALWELSKGGSYNGETANSTIPGGQFDIAITGSANQKYITSTAYVPSKANPKYKKSIKVKVIDQPDSQNVSFNYAIQAGEGGIQVGGSSEIQGNLYSNGNITFNGGGYEVEGDAFAHGVVDPNPNSRVSGQIQTGVPIVPLPDVDIEYWKTLASQGNTISGSYVPPGGTTTTMGPTKITGSFQMSSEGQVIKLTGPLYVQGAMNISGGQFVLDDSLGSSGTIVIVDGPIDISGGAKFMQNSGGGFILFISNSTDATNAIKYSGSSSSEALAVFAPVGGVNLGGSGEIVALCGKTLTISGSGEIYYKSGLANANFSGGPGGSWKVTEWQEIKNP